MRLREVSIAVPPDVDLKPFYRDVVGLGSDGEAMVAGWTTLRFVPRPDAKPVHMAFNVAEHRFADAKARLAERVALVGDEYFFEDWNAHACYFRDPAGNLLEFIARHTLPTETDSLVPLCVSEIGVAVPSVSEWLNAHPDLARYRPPTDEFATVGDEEGLFIVVREGRPWYPDFQTLAHGGPLEVVL